MLYLSHNDNTSNSIGILLSTSTFLTIIFIFQYSSLLTGQYEEKNWEDGKITWGDFKGKEIKLNKKTAIYIAVFFIYASPAAPKLSGIGGGSLVVMEPLAAS